MGQWGREVQCEAIVCDDARSGNVKVWVVLVQSFPTILAINGIIRMPFAATVAAGLGIIAAAGLADGGYHFGGDDPGWYGEDGITQEHDEGGEELPQPGCGSDIAIANGSKGDDGPIDRPGDAGPTVVRVTMVQ